MTSIGSLGIGSAGTNNPLASALKAQGLSSDTIEIVTADFEEIRESGAGSGGAGKVDAASVRAALDGKLKDDVASGKISQEDADKVTAALDKMDSAAKGAAAPAGGEAASAGKAGGGGAPSGGGGGSSGESEKTELSRTVTVADGIKTTVITYDDGSTETETSVDLSGDDTAKNAVDDAADPKEKADPAVAAAYGASEADSVEGYLATIEPGSLFDIQA